MAHPNTGAAVRHIPRRGHGWPFMAPRAPITLAEIQPTAGVPRRQEIEFQDGSRIWLLAVPEAGTAGLYLRDLGAPAEGTRVDLRHLVPEIADKLATISAHNLPGCVHYSLRLCFKSRDEFLQAAVHAGRPA